MKKIKAGILIVLGLLVLSLCGIRTKNLTSVSYKLTGIPRTTSTITIDYDKNNCIQKSVTETVVKIMDAGQGKSLYQNNLLAYKNMYKTMDGVEFNSNLSEKKMTEKTEIDVKKISKENLTILFPTSVKNGQVDLDDYTQVIESVGYKKE